MEFDSSAYEMLHRAHVEWPCLSIDVLLKERCDIESSSTNFQKWFPSQTMGNLDPQESHFDKKLGIQKHNRDVYPMDTMFCGGS